MRVPLSPFEEIERVEHQCLLCFREEAHDMNTRHGGERVDREAMNEPVDVLAVDEPPHDFEQDLLGDW